MRHYHAPGASRVRAPPSRSKTLISPTSVGFSRVRLRSYDAPLLPTRPPNLLSAMAEPQQPDPLNAAGLFGQQQHGPTDPMDDDAVQAYAALPGLSPGAPGADMPWASFVATPADPKSKALAIGKDSKFLFRDGLADSIIALGSTFIKPGNEPCDLTGVLASEPDSKTGSSRIVVIDPEVAAAFRMLAAAAETLIISLNNGSSANFTIAQTGSSTGVYTKAYKMYISPPEASFHLLNFQGLDFITTAAFKEFAKLRGVRPPTIKLISPIFKSGSDATAAKLAAPAVQLLLDNSIWDTASANTPSSFVFASGLPGGERAVMTLTPIMAGPSPVCGPCQTFAGRQASRIGGSREAQHATNGFALVEHFDATTGAFLGVKVQSSCATFRAMPNLVKRLADMGSKPVAVTPVTAAASSGPARGGRGLHATFSGAVAKPPKTSSNIEDLVKTRLSKK